MGSRGSSKTVGFSEVIAAYKEKIQTLNESVKRIEEEEKTERAVRQAQVALEKTEEKLKNGGGTEERVWFQSKQEKKAESSKNVSNVAVSIRL